MSKLDSDHMPFNPQSMDAVELHPAICGLIWSLPWWDNADWELTRKWTAEERDLWIKAFIAVTDLILIAEQPDAEKAKPAPIVAAPAPPKKDKNNSSGTQAVPEIPSFAAPKAPIVPDVPALIDSVAPEKFSEVAPYRGAKGAATVIWDIIQRAGKSASVWLNKEGRVRVGRPDRSGTDTEQLVGIYEPTVKKNEIAEDLKAAGP